jgi:hypothetical protein
MLFWRDPRWRATPALKLLRTDFAAVELGKDDAVALALSGWGLAYVARDLGAAAGLIDRAIMLNLRLVDIHQSGPNGQMIGLIGSLQASAVMSMPPESERPPDSDCPYCLLRREIIAVRFSLFKPCTALFVCPFCGSTFADVDGPSNKRSRSWHLKAYLLLRSGRLVEYEGGGEETRSNKWLAELKQHYVCRNQSG